MEHPELLRVEAYFDDELDAVGAAALERHVEQCAECRERLQDLEQTRAALRQELTYLRAPPALRARLAAALDTLDTAGAGVASEPPRRQRLRWLSRPFWAGAAGGGMATALAAALAVMLWMPAFTHRIDEDLVSAHVRSLMSGHLIDVVSTDRHTVKPWFAGRTDVSPVVADFAAQGYRLLGGRADYVDHQRAAVVVYQHGAHVINVFSWAGSQPALRSQVTHNGYRLVFWRSGDLEYCAVSDTSSQELLALVRLLQGLGAGDAGE